MFGFKERPVWTYGMRLPYHSPAQMAAKIKTLKIMWFVIPVIAAANSGAFRKDPLPAVLAILITWVLGLAFYYLMRFILGRRARMLASRLALTKPSRRPGLSYR